MATSSDNNSKRGGTGEVVPNKKMITSCDQKLNHCDSSSDDKTTIDTVSDILGRLDITNNDELLFQDPPPKEECPICMLPMPHSSGICGVHITYQPCCGKMLCYGCIMMSVEEREKGKLKDCCAFCRLPTSKTNKELVKRINKRMKLNDAEAFFMLGGFCYHGMRGVPKNTKKALELWKQGAELGSISAHYNIGNTYFYGRGVEHDMGKAMHHYRLAAIGGHEKARCNLGGIEERNDNHRRAMKHFIIAASAGDELSLTAVGKGYRNGFVTKDVYAITLRAHQSSCDDMKSKERTKAEPMYASSA